jgi:CelD/BcsL family acetyltransferase involved in cellulose biosynthesis
MSARTALDVEVLQPHHCDTYDRFIRSHPESLFYHSWAYKEFLKRLIQCEEQYLVALDGGEVRAALPLMSARTGDGRVYNSLPFFGTSAGIISSDEHAYAALAEAYNDIATSSQTLSATVVGSQFGPRRDAEMLSHNYRDARVAQMTALPSGEHLEEQLLASFDSSARRNISKARSAGISVETNHDEMTRLHDMHRAGMDAIGGTSKPERFFELVPQCFTPHVDFDLYVARRDGTVIAALLVFYLSRTVEYFVPAVDPESRPLHPLTLVIATAMADAARRGFRWWNWGGTWPAQTGVYRFKRKWGALERPYAYYTQLNDPSLRMWPRERLLGTWPYFFILPFSQLIGPQVPLA